MALCISSAHAGLELKYTSDEQILYSIFFLDNTYGWACGGLNVILRTTNGGESWHESSVPDTTSQENKYLDIPITLSDISFLSKDVGFCLRWNLIEGYGSGTPDIHSLYRSTDGGINWQRMPGVADSVVSYSFCDETTGYVTCFNYYDQYWWVQKTEDGGETWDVVRREKHADSTIYRYPYVLDILCVDRNTCFLLYGERSPGGSHWSYLDVTRDAGSSWEQIYASDPMRSTIPAGRIRQSADSSVLWLFGWKDFENFHSPGYHYIVIDIRQDTYERSLISRDDIAVLDASAVGDNEGLFFVGYLLDNPDSYFKQEYLAYSADNGITLEPVWIVPPEMDKDYGTWFSDFTATDNKTAWLTYYDEGGPEQTGIYKYTVESLSVEQSTMQDSPTPLTLYPPSPNPFNPSGQKVTTLVDRNMPAGRHSVVFDGSSLASGVYFYRLETPGFAKTGKMLLVK